MFPAFVVLLPIPLFYDSFPVPFTVLRDPREKCPPLSIPSACVCHHPVAALPNPEWESSEIHVLPIPSSFVSSPSAPINHPALSEFPVSPPFSQFPSPSGQIQIQFATGRLPIPPAVHMPAERLSCYSDRQVPGITNDNFVVRAI